ncbi:MAG TPA: hypothetical protein VL551_14645 [Actinospica sp.]|jgi:hypothetical protein|nr:hypothetical protein [Actinospica sp.]
MSYVWSVVIALAIVVVGSYRIVPAANARTKATEVVHEDRRQFNSYVITILAACAKLNATASGSERSYAEAQLLKHERDRWVAQIDDATKWMIDNLERVALSYLNLLGYRDLLLRYSFAVRMVWISERSAEERQRMIVEMTEPVQAIFFVRPRWRAAMVRHKEVERLSATLDRFEGRSSDEASA